MAFIIHINTYTAHTTMNWFKPVDIRATVRLYNMHHVFHLMHYDRSIDIIQACKDGNLGLLIGIMASGIEVSSGQVIMWMCQYAQTNPQPLADYMYYTYVINLSSDNIRPYLVCALQHHNVKMADWLRTIDHKYNCRTMIVTTPFKNKLPPLKTNASDVCPITDASSITDPNICPLCMDQPCNIKTPCQHQFCGQCLATWLMSHRSCPNCRRVMP
jgi:hypothetical protein